MAEMMIVITPENTVENIEYTGFQSAKEVVNGELYYIASMNISVIPSLAGGKFSLPVDFISNERSNEKLNAFGTLISGIETRGNVVILVNIKNGNRGFDYHEEYINGVKKETLCECWSAKDTLKGFLKNNKAKLEYIAAKFDKNKNQKQDYAVTR